MAPHFSVENATDSELDLGPVSVALERTCAIESINQAVTVLLTTDEHIRELNLKFRGMDAKTDVLTFPSAQAVPFPLGDIAISLPYATLQAEAREVSLQDELVALVVHGVLHLNGYDDETDDEKLKMQQRMNEIGAMIGTPIDASWTSVLHQDGEEDGE